ncbi:MAG: ABC transporter permease [Bacilli bacterium]
MINKIWKVLVIALALSILYAPILVIAFLSFNNSARPYEFNGLTLKWYFAILSDKTLLNVILNTWGIALASTIISTILGTFIAIRISFLKQRHKKIVIFLNNMPILNADIVTGISLMIVFTLLGFKFGQYTMLLAHIFFSIPYVILSILPRLKNLDSNTYDAALDLGCTHFKAVYKVIIPAISLGILSGAIIAFTMSIDDFVISYYTTGNGFANFSTWIYSRLNRRSFSPSAYSYNTLITMGLLLGLLYFNLTKKGDDKHE